MKMTPEIAAAYVMHGDESIQELAKSYLKMYNACGDLYYAAVWYADRPVNSTELWEVVRDVCGFIPGNSPAPTALGVQFAQAQKTPNPTESNK